DDVLGHDERHRAPVVALQLHLELLRRHESELYEASPPLRRWPSMSRARHVVLVVGDVVALVLFALLGLASHHKSIGAHGLFRDAFPVVVGWLLAAGTFDLYRRPSRGRFLVTWLAGVGGGVLVRGLVLHRHVLGGSYLSFLAVSLIVTLVLLLAWRGAYWLVRERIDRHAPARE